MDGECVDGKDATIKRWIEWMTVGRRYPTGWKYNSLEHFVQTHGQYFNPKPLPKSIKPGMMKMCFPNSRRIAKRHGLIYCEGLARRSVTSIPLLHAWCIDADRNVIDPTWNESIEYFGIPLRLEYVVKRVKKSGWQSALDSPPEFPLISGTLDDRPETWKVTI